jgi:hypothetical protein
MYAGGAWKAKGFQPLARPPRARRIRPPGTVLKQGRIRFRGWGVNRGGRRRNAEAVPQRETSFFIAGFGYQITAQNCSTNAPDNDIPENTVDTII